MYFKQLEMTGFKSFADRTMVRLEPGITAVVGPNGCGKSNILDAMRWALGEQNARELRGSHMQDVVFNGSEHRHAMGMAEVSIVFDNSDSVLPVDFSEVEVTRRVYRSGESEYLLNKAPCRLKDIHELFMDTGIGTQAYSMVGQGKMDMILSSKPEDRRYLFEEAAGIIKYKSRKRVAMRKLEGAEQNLLRLNDIVAEVQRQMRSLKRQVNAAIRYRELSEQLREIEIRSAWLTFTRLSAEIVQLRETFAAAQDAYEGESARISEFEARREELNLSKLEMDRVLMARREGVHEIDSEMEKIERQIALLRQQIDFSGEQQQQALREQEAYRRRAAAIETEIAQTAERLERIGGDLQACTEAFEAKQSGHAGAIARVEEADAALEAMRARAVEQMNTRAKTQTELEKLAVGISNIETQLGAIYEQQNAIGARRDQLLLQLEDVRGQENIKLEALADIESKRTQARDQLAQQTQELKALEQVWQGQRERKSSTEARLTSLRELRDAYEGFAVGVRAIMRAKAEKMPEARGVIGPAGDLLSTEKTYEAAIEAALGGNINNIVVDDAEAAKNAISFLKRSQAGRVTFLPLDIIRGGRGDDGGDLAGQPGIVGPALDYVQYDAKLRPAVEYLLHSTLIVETLDDAIRIARKYEKIPRLVTLDGEVVSASGAVTGGRNKHESRGLLGRSAEIGELDVALEKLKGDIEGTIAKSRRLEESIQKSMAQTRELEHKEHGMRREINELGVMLARCTTEIDNLVDAAQKLDQQRDELCVRRDGLEEQQREVLRRAEGMDSDDETFQREMSEAQERASHARQELSVHGSEVSELRLQQATLAQHREEAERDRSRLDREREEALREATRRDEVVEQLKRQASMLEEEAALQVERSKALSESKEEARGKVIEAENQRAELLNEGEAIDKSLRELREKARSSQTQLHQTEMALRHNEDRVGFFQERILTEYNVALPALTAEQAGADEYDDATRDGMVADLRAKLQRMGEVNLMAIEEYEALEKRNEFLTTQYADLQQARETLLGVVARCDKKIRELFMETFTQIADNFRVYFRRLFNGGQARVYLLNEDDPLESGIEIEARPPGKKPTSISLLSGGESAMTAIALLFGIFKAKPSPFCILDEVDAPLDDANIGRFLDMVEEFTSESQFIVITHNKQTMARAGALYGVTMQERGVSQLVSVKFDEARKGVSAA
ncbi:MAG TPA: chromosome segregation protein SMC [Candidatus Hydrogenedentes bacterium]|nr:chromosome segregation protein SMC [Candidatus Hydrogenedentota bacterium]HOS02255.1 chromosome segregation protein SMC [Candidatus Hydrogenedentota bacterium]